MFYDYETQLDLRASRDVPVREQTLPAVHGHLQHLELVFSGLGQHHVHEQRGQSVAPAAGDYPGAPVPVRRTVRLLEKARRGLEGCRARSPRGSSLLGSLACPIDNLTATGTGGAATTQVAAPTFTREYRADPRARCGSCHRPGASAPFSLIRYRDVLPRVRQMAQAVKARTMPPWLPEAGPLAFANERRLTSAEIGLIDEWVRLGAPQGDPADLQARPMWSEGWQSAYRIPSSRCRRHTAWRKARATRFARSSCRCRSLRRGTSAASRSVLVIRRWSTTRRWPWIAHADRGISMPRIRSPALAAG